MTQAITKREAAEVERNGWDVLDKAVNLALEKGTVDALEKILAMRERYEANEARKAYAAALGAFKANPPKLEKVKQVDFSSKTGGRVNYKYAPLDYICETIGAELSKHGLTFTWNVDQSDAQHIKVTCLLRHEQGHSEAVTMVAGLHDDTRMNSIQRLGATITYLERYTLLAATGLSTADEDTDGLGDRWLDHFSAMEAASDLDELQAAYKEAYREASKVQDFPAMKKMLALKDKRKAELAQRGREPGE